MTPTMVGPIPFHRAGTPSVRAISLKRERGKEEGNETWSASSPPLENSRPPLSRLRDRLLLLPSQEFISLFQAVRQTHFKICPVSTKFQSKLVGLTFVATPAAVGGSTPFFAAAATASGSVRDAAEPSDDFEGMVADEVEEEADAEAASMKEE